MERKIARVEKRSGEALVRRANLKGKSKSAEAYRMKTSTWIWPISKMASSFWGWRVGRLNKKLSANAQVISALTQASRAVEEEYNNRLGLKGLTQQTRLARARAEMGTQIPQIQRRFRTILVDLSMKYGQGKGRSRIFTRLITNIQLISTPEQVIEFESYLRMAQRAFAQNNAAEARQYLDLMTQFLTPIGPNP
jgi:hypothetical protein